MDNKITYIDLFSGAGIGSYKLKELDFECIATVEFNFQRISIQKINNKCKYEDGYFCADIRKIHTNLINYIENKLQNRKLDFILASPPCQTFSTLSCLSKEHRLKDKRNDLVVEAIQLINKLKPKVFVIENVRHFLSAFIYENNKLTVNDYIFNLLGKDYYITPRVLQLGYYGSNSSRNRTIIIGTLKDLKIDNFNLFPTKRKPKTMFEVIGNLKVLQEGEIDEQDAYHYSWIEPNEFHKNIVKNLKEGESLKNLPKEISRNLVSYAGKFRRPYYNKLAPIIVQNCYRLDRINAIHPSQNRLFTIRELMELMTIPKNFKWMTEDLNTLDRKTKIELLKKHKNIIYKAIGESIPSQFIYEIGINIKRILNNEKKEIKGGLF